jgi:hypothetical protein
LVHQIIQSNHAVYHLAGLHYEDGTPNMVLIGLPDAWALKRAEAKLRAQNIPHYAWFEPDNDFGFTAICTAPLRGEQRKAMANYRIYASVAQTGSKEHSVLTERSQGRNLPEAPDFHAHVAQNTECPTLNRTDVGGNPTMSANGGGAAASAARV